MPKKTVAVECPWCNKRFTVQIDTKYKSAEAIPQDSHLLEDEGEDVPCPNCPRQLFIRWLKQDLMPLIMIWLDKQLK